MITFSFYKVKEKKPKNGEEIILLGKQDSFGFEYFKPEVFTIEYAYLELDEEGEFTGTFLEESVENSREVLYAGHMPIEEDDYWCTVDEYWNAIDDDKEIE